MYHQRWTNQHLTWYHPHSSKQYASPPLSPSPSLTFSPSLWVSLSLSLPSPFLSPTFIVRFFHFPPADVFIDAIADIDISDKSVGETLSFACNVFTCQGGIEVAILKGSQLLAERNFTDDKDVWVPVSLTISEDTADTYVCLVVLPDRRTFNETFMVTGMCTMYAIPSYCVITR